MEIVEGEDLDLDRRTVRGRRDPRRTSCKSDNRERGGKAAAYHLAGSGCGSAKIALR